MARYESPTPTQLQDSFCSNLRSRANQWHPSWKPEEFLKIVRNDGQLDSVQELGKSNVTAATVRNIGNRFYLERKLEDALLCYNESICYAEPGTDQLAMGYANRSAVNHKQGEYEFALYNIDLAKRNNYPEKLMPKLLARELNCKQQIEAGHSKGTVPCPRMDVNVEVHPKIPFMAKGIKIDYDPRFDRGLYAERDFNTGDIIMNEKLELCGINFSLTYRHCNQCAVEVLHSLIPCPNCPFFMYCSRECLDLNWKLYHRFECAVSTKLCSISRPGVLFGQGGILFARLFFYGLSQFGDDVQAMMDYCDPEVTNVSDPLQLDYTNLNRLEVFKALHNTKPRTVLFIDEERASIATACYYAVFLMNPTVSAIIRTAVHRQFFLQTLLKYTRIVFVLMTTFGTSRGKMIEVIRPIGSLFNHSCDPNAIAIFKADTMKVILVRSIRKGEQIFTANGPIWWMQVISYGLHFKCQCARCYHGAMGRMWHKQMQQDTPPEAWQDYGKLLAIDTNREADNVTKMNAIRQLIQRYSHLHPSVLVGVVLRRYYSALCNADQAGFLALIRAEMQAKFIEH